MFSRTTILTLHVLLAILATAWTERNNPTDEANTDTVQFPSSNKKVSRQEIIDFKINYGLRQDTDLSVQVISSQNTVMYAGKSYKLVGRIADVFTPDATYMHNGIAANLPTISVVQKENQKEIITIAVDEHGDAQKVMITNKKTGNVAELARIGLGNMATIRNSDFDMKDLNDKYDFHRESVSKHLTQEVNKKSEKVISTEKCTSHNQIDLAVAYESSFCEAVGGRSILADNEVASLVAMVSSRYQQSGLCIKVKISHLEGYCDSDIDPYKEYVDIGKSGCIHGLLPSFAAYWNENRTHVQRDVVHLFSGTGLDCGEKGCFAGCAYEGTACDTSSAYGVNWTTRYNTAAKKSVVVSHELGHNAGAGHVENTSGIMYENMIEGMVGFSETSIDSIKAYLNTTNCVWGETQPLNEILISASPTPAPTLAPDCDKIFHRYFLLDIIWKFLERLLFYLFPLDCVYYAMINYN